MAQNVGKRHVVELQRTIKSMGGTIDSVVFGKHIKIYWSIAGHRHIQIAPHDHSGCPHAARNTIALLRRIVKSSLANPKI